jgi:hypothetical protein
MSAECSNFQHASRRVSRNLRPESESLHRLLQHLHTVSVIKTTSCHDYLVTSTLLAIELLPRR